MNPFAPWGEYWIFAAVFSFVMGLLWGSFFNVCIYRVPIKKSIVQPGSHCYQCGTFLRWYDNIPLVSYLLLRGTCRYCGTHFSARYFLVELLTGLIFLAIFLKFGFILAVPFHLVFAGFLIIGVFTDIDHFILPDGLTKGGTVYALAVAAALGPHSHVAGEFVLVREIYHAFADVTRQRSSDAVAYYVPFLWSAASAVFGYALLAGVGVFGRLLFRKEAMGGGDIKLFAFLGAYLGALNCVWVLFLSAFLGAVFGLSLLAAHKLVGRDEYEDLFLQQDAAAKYRYGTVPLQSAHLRERDTVVTAVAQNSTAPVTMERSETETSGSGEPLVLRIARRTSRQLHHFPFGPYIAVAALIILLFQKEIHAATREFLLLP